MVIKHLASGDLKLSDISPVQKKEWPFLTRKKFSFDWKKLRDKTQTYKLQVSGTDDILGVMALSNYPDECRLEIELISTSIENRGKNKEYEGIAGSLIAFACRLSLSLYGSSACVSLIPKTVLKQHYIQKYGMLDAGKQVFLEGHSLYNLIKKYNI